MGRKKINLENKKRNLLLSIDSILYKKFEKLEIANKSKFFNWLLEDYFHTIKKGDDNDTK